MPSKRKSGSGRLGGAAVGCLLALAMLIAAALPASAGADAHYTYEVCDPALPAGNTPGVQFTANKGVAFAGANTCSEPNGALSITETGHVAGSLAIWKVPVATTPGGFVESVTVTGKACGLGPANAHSFVYEQGWPPDCGEGQRVFHIGSPGPFLGVQVPLELVCDGSFAAGCEAGPTISARYIVAQEVDTVAPKLAALQGSLLAGGIIRGQQDLSVDASDVGGGLSRVSVTVNGLPAGEPDVPNCALTPVSNPSFVGTVANTITPCPPRQHAAWDLNTESFPFHQGANSVQVCASDYASIADPNTTCTAAQEVTIDNSCSGSTVPGGEVIDAHFAASDGNKVTVPYGEAVKVAGALTDSAGDPVRGATICVQTQTEGSSSGLKPLATTTTDAEGHFNYKLPAGPNREVLVGYRHDRFEVARTVSYFAHARPTLTLKPRRVRAGGTIRARGRVPGPGAGGRVVVEQASAPGSKRWYTFGRATTNQRGVYHFHYRFDATTATTAYRIRVEIPHQNDYAYQGGYSKPDKVRVVVDR